MTGPELENLVPVYQAGTLAGNPLAMAAGCETLRRLARPGSYEKLSQIAARLAGGLHEAADAAGVELTATHVGGMLGFFFHPGPVSCFADAQKANAEHFNTFFGAMLAKGIYLAPSPYEAGFVSLAHGEAEVDATLAAAEAALARAAAVR